MQSKIQRFFWLLVIPFSVPLLAAQETKSQKTLPATKIMSIPYFLKNSNGCVACKDGIITKLNQQLMDLRKAHKEEDQRDENAKTWKKQQENAQKFLPSSHRLQHEQKRKKLLSMER